MDGYAEPIKPVSNGSGTSDELVLLTMRAGRITGGTDMSDSIHDTVRLAKAGHEGAREALYDLHLAGIEYADGREETDCCEAGTPGCATDHTRSRPDAPCTTW